VSTTAAFTTRSTFRADHPHALALYCSDGRYTRAVEELLVHLGHERLDTLTLPGGPGLLSMSSAAFVELDATKRGASFLIAGHGIRDVFLIAHEGCGYYRSRNPRKEPAAIARVQREDLRVAAGALEVSHPELATHLYYARPHAGLVTFDPVARTPEPFGA
jgi:hypothetical protein